MAVRRLVGTSETGLTPSVYGGYESYACFAGQSPYGSSGSYCTAVAAAAAG